MDTPALDVAIGVVFMYLLLSLIVTTLQEAIAGLLKMRAQNLYRALRNLLEDPELPADWQGLAAELYRHPLIASLAGGRLDARADPDEFGSKNRFRLPSYIPSRAFAVALLDVIAQKGTPTSLSGMNQVLAQAKDVVAGVPDGNLKRALELLLADADRLGSTLDERAAAVSQRVEQWFNDSMARASGWYKRRSQMLSFVLALGVAAGLNAGTFDVARTLWQDSALRAAVVASAQAYAERDEPEVPDSLEAGIEAVQASSLPIGWSGDAIASFTGGGASPWIMMLGWLATALAVGLGAAFWFDVLGKVLQIRGAGGKVSAVTGKLEGKAAAG